MIHTLGTHRPVCKKLRREQITVDLQIVPGLAGWGSWGGVGWRGVSFCLGVIKRSLFKKIILELSLTECFRASLAQKRKSHHRLISQRQEISARMRAGPRAKGQNNIQKHPGENASGLGKL